MNNPTKPLPPNMRAQNKNRQRKSALRGFALIEALVAVFVLALGLLGMAGMQAKTLKATRSSEARSQAVMLSYYILDAMRADSAGAKGNSYNTGTSPDLPLTMVCDPDGITATTLSAHTRKHWLESLKSNLGDQDKTCGGIHCTESGECTVQVQWDDSLAGGLGEQVFTTRSRL